MNGTSRSRRRVAGSAGGQLGGPTGGLQLSDGRFLEFDGTLTYGQKDQNLTGKARTEIENWEAKRVKAKVEYAYALDKDGNPIGPEKRGGKKSIYTPYSYHSKDATFTHIHPRADDSGHLGGTFSDTDMYVFAENPNKTERAAAREGTYSISKNANFDRDGFRGYVSQVHNDMRKKERELKEAVYADFKAGKIDSATKEKLYAKAFNTALVSEHNAYIAGQQKYGYTYTLEKR